MGQETGAKAGGGELGINRFCPVATTGEHPEKCFYCLGGGDLFIGSLDESGEEIMEAYGHRRSGGTGRSLCE